MREVWPQEPVKEKPGNGVTVVEHAEDVQEEQGDEAVNLKGLLIDEHPAPQKVRNDGVD